jgi:hypothetical protein
MHSKLPQNYFSTCINIYRLFPGEMSSLENDLADLQNFLIKQSQVRSYEEEAHSAPWRYQCCGPTRIGRIWKFFYWQNLDPELPFRSMLRIRIKKTD